MKHVKKKDHSAVFRLRKRETKTWRVRHVLLSGISHSVAVLSPERVSRNHVLEEECVGV